MSYIEEAKQLANTIANSQEFKKFKELHDQVYLKNEENKKIIDDFREKIYEYQLKTQQAGKQDENELSKLQSLENILMSNPSIAEYMIAEMEYTKIIAEVNQIIEESLTF